MFTNGVRNPFQNLFTKFAILCFAEIRFVLTMWEAFQIHITANYNGLRYSVAKEKNVENSITRL